MPAKRGFAQILIILILFGILAASVINFKKISALFEPLNPPPPTYVNTTPGWKVYKNATYKFSLQYPNNWYVRTYGDYAANFQFTDPKLGEAAQGAILARFSALGDNADLSEFERIYKIGPGVPIYEPLDVESIISKIKNLEVGNERGIEYTVNRKFSALEGPRGQITHVFSYQKDRVILKFFRDGRDSVDDQKVDTVFQKMMRTLTL